MGANRTKHTTDTKLEDTIAELQKQIEFLKKTPQKIGAASLDIRQINFDLGGPFSIGTITSGNTAATFVSAFIPVEKEVITIWIPSVAIYVDGTTEADKYPSGANITGDKRSFILSTWKNYEPGDDNAQNFVIQIANLGALSHTYYYKYQISYPHINDVF